VKTKERGDVVDFQCPRHEDTNPSAWLGEHAWGCYSCGFTESLHTLGEELGVKAPESCYVLEDYAAEKGFRTDLLRSWGVDTGSDDRGKTVVVIPYRDEKGDLLRNKYRAAKRADGKRSTWWEGRDRPVHLYGRDHIAGTKSDRPVFVVEGESDCHAAWHHDVLAVGVPGANIWKPEWSQYLKGRPVFIWQEPDAAGEQFVQRIAADLPDAEVIIANGTKDLADLHKKDDKGFRDALKILMESAHPGNSGPSPIAFDPAIGGVLDRLIEDAQRPVDAVPTPFPAWNAVCRDEGGGEGLARGWDIAAGGSTGHGKSLLAANLAIGAVRQGERAAFVSLEMSQRQLFTRVLAICSGLSIRRLEPGKGFDPAQAQRAAACLNELHEETGGCLYVNRSPLSKLEDVRAAIKYQHEVHGCRFVIVDYLQLAWTGEAGTLFENTLQVAHAVRQLAVELKVVLIGLSQLNRETSRDMISPRPQGLMGGSPLENDADQVVLLDHSKYERTPTGATTELLVAKNRHGPQARIHVVWDYNTLQLREDVGDWDEINRDDKGI
jgi:archaellum biogenesis ATPase FlaH